MIYFNNIVEKILKYWRSLFFRKQIVAYVTKSVDSVRILIQTVVIFCCH